MNISVCLLATLWVILLRMNICHEILCFCWVKHENAVIHPIIWAANSNYLFNVSDYKYLKNVTCNFPYCQFTSHYLFLFVCLKHTLSHPSMILSKSILNDISQHVCTLSQVVLFNINLCKWKSFFVIVCLPRTHINFVWLL